MTSLGRPITQRQLRVGEMIKQALGMLFIREEAKLPNLSTKEIHDIETTPLNHSIDYPKPMIIHKEESARSKLMFKVV